MSTKGLHILNTIRTELDKESTFRIEKVLDREKGAKPEDTIVYVGIIYDRLEAQQQEASARAYLGEATVGIWARWKVEHDELAAGIGAAKYADVVDKIENVLNDYAVTLETNTDNATSANNILTAITGVERSSVSGFVDDGDKTGRLVYEIKVHYATGAV